MKLLKLKRIATLTLAFALTATTITTMKTTSQAKAKFTKTQQKKAEQIYKVTSKNWKKYGCLPSVCIAQGFIESGLGQVCRSNNLWGLAGGRASYSSLNNGIKAYMKCINNGYYKGAPHQKSAFKQIDKILDGGYCQPRGSYYSKAVNTINKYGLKTYDKKMFKAIKKAARIKKLKKDQKKRIALTKKTKFEVQFDESLAMNEVDFDDKYVKNGKVTINGNIYKIKEAGAHGTVIKTGNFVIATLFTRETLCNMDDETLSAIWRDSNDNTTVFSPIRITKIEENPIK